MRRRALVAPAAVLIVAVLAGAAAVPAATGCTTHQCDADCIQFGGQLDPNSPCTLGNVQNGVSYPVGDVSRDGDDVVWESSAMDGAWLDFTGGRSYTFYWPTPFVGVDPYSVETYLATGQYAQTGGNTFVNGSGQLAVVSNANAYGVTIYNSSCAEYFLRVVAGGRAPGGRLVGGQASTVQGDTWRYDGTTWRELQTSPSPPPRYGAAAASLNGSTVLFGGTDGSQPLADTWTFDGVGWTPRTPQAPATSPPARSGASMAVIAGVAVLFGGFDGSNRLGDTWTWDGTSWTQLTPSAAPPARSGAGLAFEDGKLLLFGGTDGTNVLGDSWELSGTPPTGFAWSQASVQGPPARADAALVATPTGTILFGGSDGTNALADTWVWTVPQDGGEGAWSAVQPATHPSARSVPGATTFGTTTVLFGGRDASGSPLGDTWAWDGANWTMQTPPPAPAPSPPPRFSPAMAGF